MRFSLHRSLKWLLLVLLIIFPLFVYKDAVLLNPAQKAAAPFIFDLVEWQGSNFPDKWTHRLVGLLPWRFQGADERARQVQEYFQLGAELAGLGFELQRVAAETGPGAEDTIARLESNAEEIRATRTGLRGDVEEALEAAISEVLAEEGVGSWGEFLFPPVDIRLDGPPKLLVTSPRDRIERQHDVLIDPDIRLVQREQVESHLLVGSNLSAVVLDIGGLATYPASIPDTQPLRWTVQASAHEWFHHYFYFRSFGQNMFTDSEMLTLNETVAEMAGRDIGDRTYRRLGGNPEPISPGTAEVTEDAAQESAEFDFNREMRTTRVRADELLAEGGIEEAEAYMEERRKVFLENGFAIRKLNQAYFAFHGTYAESGASVSPIGDQLAEFRKLMPDLKTFIHAMSAISNYQQFLDVLRDLRAGGTSARNRSHRSSCVPVPCGIAIASSVISL